VAEVFGHELPTLMATAGARGPQALQLSNGLGVWLRARLQMAPGARSDDAEGRRAPAAVAATQVVPAAEASATAAGLEPAPDAAPTLAEHDHRLVLQALARNGGNVSRAARELGVSRGLLYRRLAAARGRQGDGSGA
jgi:DNA-binding NtrC family response regulator